jgi:hypothetical protein
MNMNLHPLTSLDLGFAHLDLRGERAQQTNEVHVTRVEGPVLPVPERQDGLVLGRHARLLLDLSLGRVRETLT